MLKNASLLAIVAVNTAENEPSKVCRIPRQERRDAEVLREARAPPAGRLAEPGLRRERAPEGRGHAGGVAHAGGADAVAGYVCSESTI